ncbi:MAG: hypothetical protein U9O20_02810 [Patescibacteria group bacterium]|nr:hypothetical protein [Patescibacteria group bacterium]
MRKVFIAIVTVVLLILDWAALSDILKDESNVNAEYVTLIGSVVILLVMLSYTFKQKKGGGN